MCGDIYPRYSNNYYHSNHYGIHNISYFTYFTDETKDFVIYKVFRITSTKCLFVVSNKTKLVFVVSIELL